MSGGPLRGITVVEFGRFIAVPYCGQLLADAGARVVKVEPLEGDATREHGIIVPGEGRQYLNKNRGKESVSLNLRTVAGVEIARRLAARADVVLANFRPQLAASLTLDYASLRAVNPRVIYAATTAFGTAGEDADQPGFDVVVQAYSGLYASLAPHGDRPPDPGLPLTDYVAAVLLAWGIMLALWERVQTGEGQEVATSLLAASLVLQNNRLTHIDAIDGWRHDFLRRLPDLKVGRPWSDINQVATAMQPQQVHPAYTNAYPTADGTIVIACYGRPLQRRLLTLLNLDDPWVTDPAWEAPEDPRPHMHRVYHAVAAAMRTRTTAAWLRAFRAAGIPASEVRHWAEMLDHQQARANGLIHRFEHDRVGGVTTVGPPVQLSRTPLQPAFPPRPLGADTVPVLAELGYGHETIARFIEEGVVRVA